MELRLRPYATAGVALVGASAIAMAPLAPPLPDVKMASPSVNLSADIDPFTPWVNVFENAETNLAGLIDDWAEAPFPVLQQVIVNQLNYFSELPDFELIAGQIVANLEAAVAVLYEQDLSTLGPGFVNGVPNPAIKQLVFGLLPTFVPALADLQPLLDFSTSPLSGVLFGLIGPVVGPALALASSIEAIVGNLTGEDPDPFAALNTLINIPATMADAFLNGGQVLNLTPLVSALNLDLPEGTEIGIAFGGLLSPGGSIFNALDIELDYALAPPPVPPFHISVPGQGPGAIGSLINLTQAIARAIGWDGTGNPLHEEDAPPPAPLLKSGEADDISLLNASTTEITVSETPVTEEEKTGDVTPPAEGAAAGSGVSTEGEQVKVVEDNLPVVLDEGTDTTPEKPAPKKLNPGAKIAGALKSAGDQLNSAVNDLGKKLTKRPSKKAPTADNEKASAPEKDTSTDKAPAASE